MERRWPALAATGNQHRGIVRRIGDRGRFPHRPANTPPAGKRSRGAVARGRDDGGMATAKALAEIWFSSLMRTADYRNGNYAIHSRYSTIRGGAKIILSAGKGVAQTGAGSGNFRRISSRCRHAQFSNNSRQPSGSAEGEANRFGKSVEPFNAVCWLDAFGP